ncbi:MAG: glycosyltransferase family 2 protein, partial [Actinomycetota bacterium]
DLLPKMPTHIDGHDVRIMLVDDGSTDRTSAIARDHGCTTITSEKNRGKGASLQIGLEALRDLEYDALVLMDSDGQHDPEQLEAMTTPILDGSADLVVGSRYLGNPGRGKAPRNRYAVRSATVFLVNRILSVGITDPYSGYRALTPLAARCMELSGDRYESELEMLFCASRHEMRVIERPIPKIYGPETSKMGARYGAVFGRIDVVSRYALTIARGAIAAYLPESRNAKDKISA